MSSLLLALADLSQAHSGAEFMARLCACALEYTRAHGVQARLGEHLPVVACCGRGLGLSDGALARAAVQAQAAQASGMMCALALRCAPPLAALEVVGGSESGLADLQAALPLLSLALEGALAREAQRGHGRVTETLAQLSARIGGSLDLPQVLTATAHSAADALGFERALVGLFRPSGPLSHDGPLSAGRTHAAFTYGFEDGFFESVSGDIGVGPESFERLMQRGEVIAYDAERDAATPLARGLSDFAPQLALIAPLKARGRPLGILYADVRSRRAAFGEGDGQLLLALAEQASLAIDNARLYADETRKRHVAESLREVGVALSRSLHLADTLQSVLNYARTLFGAGACAVHELQSDGRTLSIRSAVGLSSEYVLKSRARLGAGVTGKAVQRGELNFTRDIREEPQAARSGGSRYTRQLLAAGKYPFQGVVGLPLAARGHSFGGLTLYYAEPLPLDSEDLALCEVFAAQAALAIENARLYEDEVRRERESAAQLSIAAQLHSPVLPQHLRHVARELTLALGAERGLLVTLEGGALRMAPYNVPQLPDEAALTWLASQLGRGPRPLTRRHLLPGALSGLLSPLVHQSAVLGYFYADQSREDAPSEKALQLARTVSDQVASSLSREKLLRALEREEARYRLLAHSAHDLIIATDPQGTVTYANPASQRLLGPLEGCLLSGLLSGDSARAFEVAWQASLSAPESGGRCEIEMGGLERVLHLEVRLSAVTAPGGEISGLLLLARDLSELQTLAEEIRRRGQALEAASERQGQLRDFLALFTQAQEEERGRISRELHDDTAQVLVAIGRRLDRLGRDLAAAGQTEGRERAADIRQDLNAAIESVRRFARNLRPSVLDDLGLLPALEWLASQQVTPTRLEVQGAERRLPGGTELTIFRVVQEALSNVDKHAQASSAAVRVVYHVRQVEVSISDDGRGLDPKVASERARQGHMGLLGLRERVALSGGELQLEVGEDGRGTQLRFGLEG